MTDPATLSLRDLDDAKLAAVIEAMFLAAYADGEFTDDERVQFRQSVQSITAGRVQGERLDEMIARVEKAAEGDREERLKVIRGALPETRTRELALHLAIQLMAADGIIRTSERELILELADGLEIDRDHAADMVKKASAT